MGDGAVKVFISYSWDSKEHKKWVRKLSDDLNRAGIDTILDVKDMDVGDPIPEFMEKSISDSDFVLVVLTPNYKTKADKRLGGVGVEDSIIAADIYEKQNHRKYKTILAAGTWSTSTPTWARSKLGVDMSSEDVYEEGLERIIESCMRGRAKPKPQVKAETLTKEEYFKRGYQKGEAGDYKGAIADYTKAIQLDPNYAVAYNNRGSTYNDLKQYDKAIVDLNKAIQLDPNDADAYNSRGSAYYYLKQYDKAIVDLNKAIQLDPNDADAYNSRGSAYYYLKQHGQAIVDYTKAIQLDPNYAYAYYNRGIAYDDLKQYDQAIVDYTKAIQLDPNDPDYYNDRAITYDKIGKRALAKADRAKARELESRK